MSPSIEQAARAMPGLAKAVMRLKIDHYSSAAPARPHCWSLWSPAPPPGPGQIEECGEYVSWPGLVDKSWTGRHLGPDTTARALPTPDQAAALYARAPAMKTGRASALFGLFAQWFTDSFLRTMPGDRRRTDSNHEIDLCQIYGLDERTGRALRAHRGGELKTRTGPNGGQFPPLLFRDGALDPAFADLGYLRPECVGEDGQPRVIDRAARWTAGLDSVFGDAAPGPISDPARRDNLYALGLERGGSTIVYSAISTVFIREHNNIAKMLRAENPAWDDERLFQTARLINIRQILTVVMEDYIAFIGDSPLVLDRSFAEAEPWYRANRTSIEFNMVYRFHGLTPDAIVLDGTPLGHIDYRYNNALLEQHGVGAIITAASSSPGGAVELRNTPSFLVPAEIAGLRFTRDFKVRPFNDYRRRFGLRPYRTIEAMTGGAEWTADLHAAYSGDVNAVELPIGLNAEQRRAGELFGETLMTMVAHDAFTHVLTNPALAEEVHRADVFTDPGLAYIEETFTLPEIVQRNCEDEGDVLTCFTSPNWPGVQERSMSPLG